MTQGIRNEPDAEHIETSLSENTIRQLAPLADHSIVSAQSSEHLEPKIPDDLEEDERMKLGLRADEIIDQLLEVSGREKRELEDAIAHVGFNCQSVATNEYETLRLNVVNLTSTRGPGTEISEKMIDLRNTLDKLSPTQLRRPGFWRSIFSIMPWIDGVASHMEVFKRVAMRTQPVSAQADAITESLRQSRMALVNSNSELESLYAILESQKPAIQRNAYLAELLVVKLREKIREIDDPKVCDELQERLHDAAIRAQDLRTIEFMGEQYRHSLDMTRRNNIRLGQSIDRTIFVGRNVIYVSIAIINALQEQGMVFDQNEALREFIGMLFVANAEIMREHTRLISDLYRNPVIGMDKIAQAHGAFVEALDEEERLKSEGIDSAIQNIRELSEMSQELEQKTQRLHNENLQIKSLEA